MGCSSVAPGIFRQQFIAYAIQNSSQKYPALDIGAAYGVATLPAVRGGAWVIANDLDQRHLTALMLQLNHESEEIKQRLTVKLGCILNEIEFPENSLSAILISAVLHFFTGKEIERLMAKMYRWLKPGGKLFTQSFSPYLNTLQQAGVTEQYEIRRAQGEKWPGCFPYFTREFGDKHAWYWPDTMHFLDADVLKKILEKAGFIHHQIHYTPFPQFKDGVFTLGCDSILSVCDK